MRLWECYLYEQVTIHIIMNFYSIIITLNTGLAKNSNQSKVSDLLSSGAIASTPISSLIPQAREFAAFSSP